MVNLLKHITLHANGESSQRTLPCTLMVNLLKHITLHANGESSQAHYPAR